MEVTTNTPDRLVLSTDRRKVAFVGIISAPAMVWLGLLIVRDGDTEWFGHTFAGLGVVMGLLAIAAMFLRISLVLDRTGDLIRLSHQSLGRRRNRTLPLSALDRVECRELVTNRQSHSQVVFVPNPDTNLPELKVAEFWTRSAAEDAHHAITRWLRLA